MGDQLISVIVPIHKVQKNFKNVRAQLIAASTSIEIIYIIDKELNNDFINPIKSNEQIIKIKNIGRGYMLAEGVRHVKGDIIMFLHSDTVLPKDWDISILRTMKDEKVMGGGFSLKFDVDNLCLNLSLKMVSVLIRFRKIFSGDRAIFLRTHPFKNDMPNLEIPIMEDLEISKWMNKHGKVVLLKDIVVTSADAFVKNGLIRQSWKIVKCMLWYNLGGDLSKIYSYYYS